MDVHTNQHFHMKSTKKINLCAGLLWCLKAKNIARTNIAVIVLTSLPPFSYNLLSVTTAGYKFNAL